MRTKEQVIETIKGRGFTHMKRAVSMMTDTMNDKELDMDYLESDCRYVLSAVKDIQELITEWEEAK